MTTPLSLPPFQDRRSDDANETIVNAALKLAKKIGIDLTHEFLMDAGLPAEVIGRVLSGGPKRAQSENAIT